MYKKAFTMVEIIFIIVIIGILASMAIPRFTTIRQNAKISVEIATISTVSTALESANGEWSINEGDFTWGNHRSSNEINSTTGYPRNLGSSNDKPFDYVIKKSDKFKKQSDNGVVSIFTGPASDPQNGVTFDKNAPNQDIKNKPDKNDFWVYVYGILPDQNCTINGKILYLGDITLIDVNGTSTTDYNSVGCGWTQP